MALVSDPKKRKLGRLSLKLGLKRVVLDVKVGCVLLKMVQLFGGFLVDFVTGEVGVSGIVRVY